MARMRRNAVVPGQLSLDLFSQDAPEVDKPEELAYNDKLGFSTVFQGKEQGYADGSGVQRA